MDKAFEFAPGIEVLPSHVPLPEMGYLPINAFVIKADEPVLVDTGTGRDSDEFMKTLRMVVDPQELKWVWITHDDSDHTGSIQKILEAAPKARLAANALAVMRMNAAWPVPMDRVYWLNHGDGISVGDRKLTAIRPPLFDNPTTIGIYDDKSDIFFSADCFGAIIPTLAQDADDLKEDALAQGMLSWASGDCPWVHAIPPEVFARQLDTLRQLAPKSILSAHLPPASGMTARLLDTLALVPASKPFIAPKQAVLAQMLTQTEN
jgi:glyoxylase-like metal-dependent hydrolase (beta-lactamase superfamily II)